MKEAIIYKNFDSIFDKLTIPSERLKLLSIAMFPDCYDKVARFNQIYNQIIVNHNLYRNCKYDVQISYKCSKKDPQIMVCIKDEDKDLLHLINLYNEMCEIVITYLTDHGLRIRKSKNDKERTKENENMPLIIKELLKTEKIIIHKLQKEPVSGQ